MLARHMPEWNLIDGRAVIELKPRSIDKGRACARLLQHAPFYDRRPVYLGDDTTDLDAFMAVQHLGGHTVSVGPRIAGRAHLALGSPRGARDWLGHLEHALRVSNDAVASFLTTPFPNAG